MESFLINGNKTKKIRKLLDIKNDTRITSMGIIKFGRFLLWAWKYFILKYIFERPMILFISEINKQGHDLVGVEIGVYKGDNAFFILNKLPIKKLFLLDPYLKHREFENNVGWTKVNQSDFNKHFLQAKKKLKQFEDKITFIRKKSENAVNQVPNNLDFVYIDGNHEYEFVKRDIELYYPKLKHGGILGGDNFESVFPSVARAVLEFTDKYNLKIYGNRSDASYEWWVIKK
ncbi:MAG: class I SAM-dependent methyltransferase [bacterium]|nr:class I SAM-dependent methyltransferase [bacterium]